MIRLYRLDADEMHDEEAAEADDVDEMDMTLERKFRNVRTCVP